MHNNSYAAFAQTDWNFTPTWKLTTGLRYTYDILKGGEQFRELCFGLPACLGNVFGNIPTPYILGAFTPVNDITASNPAIANCFTAVGCNYRGVRGKPVPAFQRHVGPRLGRQLEFAHRNSGG